MNPQEARAVLGLDADATKADARRAHRRLAKLLHPDRFGEGDDDQRAAATEAMARLNLALEVVLGEAEVPREASPPGPQTREGSAPSSSSAGAKSESSTSGRPVTEPSPPPAGPATTSGAASRPAGSGRRLAGVAVVLVSAVIALVYVGSHSGSATTGFTGPSVPPTTADSGRGLSETPSPQATVKPAAPSPTLSASVVQTPTAASWPPAGYAEWSDTIAYKWAAADSFTCPASTFYGCWLLMMTARDGCLMATVEATVLDAAGKDVGTTRAYAGGQRRMKPTKFYLSDTSSDGSGADVRIDDITCN